MTTPASGEYRDRIAAHCLWHFGDSGRHSVSIAATAHALWLGDGRTTGQCGTILHAMIPGMCIYALLGIGLIWLGVGSILARR